MRDHPTNPDIKLVDGPFYCDPHPHFLWMRENAPVYWDEAGRVWGVSLYEDVMAVSRDPETFCCARLATWLKARPGRFAAPPPSASARSAVAP